MTGTTKTTWVIGLALGAAAMTTGANAAAEEWRLVRPSNTGIPGEEMRTVEVAPDGTIWACARWPFWGEGGIGIYDIGNDTWVTHSNAETGSGPGPIPSEFVNDIEFAADGSAWIATGGGVMHFDGTTWTVYDSSNTPMALDNVWDLSIAPDGHIWINNSHFNFGGDAIWDFDGVTWTAYRVGEEIPFADPWDDLDHVFAASNGDVWVSNSTLAGVARLHNGTWTLLGDSIGGFDDITEDTSGNIWIAPDFNAGTLAKWNGSAFTTYNVGLYVTDLAADTDGAIYYGNWGGVVKRTYDEGQTWETYLSGLNIIFSIAPDPAGDDVWIATIGALGHFTGTGQWLRDYNSITTGMPDYFIEDLHLGQVSGDLLIASAETGATRYDGTRWENRGSHNPNFNWPVLADGADAVYEDRFGAIWIGTNGVARWTDEQFDLWDWRNTAGFGVTSFWDFAEDMNGTLFAFEKYGRVFRFHPQTRTWTEEPIFMYAVLGIPGAEADSQGNIYFGGWFDIARWDGATWTVLELPYTDFLYDLGGASTLDVAPDDTLWIGTRDGLVQYDGESWTVYDAANTPMIVDAISGIDFRDDGVMGLALSDLGDTSNCGAAIVDGAITDPASWRIYRYGETPIPHYQLGGVSFDSAGDLWISAISEAVAVLHVPRSNRVLPSGFDTVFGAFQSGSLADLLASDDSYVVIQQRPAFSVLLPLVRLEANATANGPAASQMVVTVEAGTSALPTQSPQKLFLFDYDANSWELVDERTATVSDSVVEVTISANAGRFIDDATNAMRMRIDWFDPGNVFSPAWVTRTDQAVWTVTP